MSSRLTSIDRPPTLLARIAFWGMQRLFGRVPTPYQVIFARLPQALFAQLQIVYAIDRRMTLDPVLRLLLAQHVASLNHCTFCVDISRMAAVQRQLSLEKVDALADYRHDPRFDARERAALTYAEESTRDRHVRDETFVELRAHFSDAEIVEMTWLTAVENYFNLLNVPLGIDSDGLCAIAERRQLRPAHAS